ncbi:MAG TPA: hypothetical protein VEU30_03635 [Thermoanaerobaculia bacterium]|nr:hypothetical protein [Thermoanaerobaculia bacterium]
MKSLAIVVAGLAFVACGKQEPPARYEHPCPPDTTLITVAARDIEPETFDCGCVDMNSSPQRRATVQRCTAEHFAVGRAFHARFEMQGIDSQVSKLVIGTTSRQLIEYTNDSLSPHYTRYVCRAPTISPDKTAVYCPDTNRDPERIPR